MKRFLALLVLVIVAIAVALWRAPASLIAGLLPPDVARVAQLHEATGTIWRGKMLLTVAGVPPSLSVAWRCRPSFSPIGVRCELSESVAGDVTLDSLSGVLRAERVALSIPLQIVMGGGTMAASPEVIANLSEVVAAHNSLRIKGSVRAADASYRLGQSDVALGEVTIDCSPAPDAATSACAVSNRGGSARLDGRLTLSTGKATGTIELIPAGGPAQRVAF